MQRNARCLRGATRATCADFDMSSSPVGSYNLGISLPVFGGNTQPLHFALQLFGTSSHYAIYHPVMTRLPVGLDGRRRLHQRPSMILLGVCQINLAHMISPWQSIHVVKC